MKLIIDIPEEEYISIRKQVLENITNPLKVCIANGIPYKEIPQGEWECVRVGNTNFITCSHCKEQFETENTLELWQDEYKFCHRCGAKMKKGGAEE